MECFLRWKLLKDRAVVAEPWEVVFVLAWYLKWTA
jgi:hypothetical protein